MFDYQRGKDICIGPHRIPVMVFLGGVPRGNRNHPNDWATKGNPTSDWVKKGMTRLPTIHHPNEKSGLNIYSNPKKWCKRIKVQPFQIGCYFCVKNWGLKKNVTETTGASPRCRSVAPTSSMRHRNPMCMQLAALRGASQALGTRSKYLESMRIFALFKKQKSESLFLDQWISSSI